MTLAGVIAARIRQNGPISMADYMVDCLLHPDFGYYVTRDPLGVAGDFITAPEISQMFGEVVGLSLAQAWIDQGSSPRFTLAELGPGRGTLMADALRAAGRVPGFAAAAEVILLEASPVLRAAQADALGQYDPRWIETVDALPAQPLFLVANEFFDALPVRQFQRGNTGWCERRIGLNGDDLVIGLAAEAPHPALDHRLADTRAGNIVEHCAAAAPIVDVIARRIADHGGAALIVDYGDWRSLGDTVQALRDHKSVPILETPGSADLTAHVDFELIADTARRAGCAHTRLTPQGIFLERLGITHRAQTLAEQKSGEALDQVVSAHRRLTHPGEMGNLFKVLGLYPESATAPPGLDP
ncbi:class I SAM-dependent methyltransferase [Arenibacterium sp. CAU 1754]